MRVTICQCNDHSDYTCVSFLHPWKTTEGDKDVDKAKPNIEEEVSRDETVNDCPKDEFVQYNKEYLREDIYKQRFYPRFWISLIPTSLDEKCARRGHRKAADADRKGHLLSGADTSGRQYDCILNNRLR